MTDQRGGVDRDALYDAIMHLLRYEDRGDQYRELKTQAQLADVTGKIIDVVLAALSRNEGAAEGESCALAGAAIDYAQAQKAAAEYGLTVPAQTPIPERQPMRLRVLEAQDRLLRAAEQFAIAPAAEGEVGASIETVVERSARAAHSGTHGGHSEIEPDGDERSKPQAGGDADQEGGGSGEIRGRDALLSGGLQRSERAVCLEDGGSIVSLGGGVHSPALAAEGDCVLRAALENCASTFRHYAKLHYDKGTPEGAEKGAANLALAQECDAALAAAPASPADTGGGVYETGHFHLDRLDDFENAIITETDAREFHGHVVPAAARFRAALASRQHTEAPPAT